VPVLFINVIIFNRIINVGEKVIKILITIITLISFTVHSKEIEKDDWEYRREMCEIGTKIARIAMEARQQNVPIEVLYEDLSVTDKNVRNLFLGIINSAYDAPIIQSKKLAEMATVEFTNQFFKTCMT